MRAISCPRLAGVLLAVMSVTGWAGLQGAEPQSGPAGSGQAAVAGTSAPPDEKPSYFTALWQLDRKTRASQPGITFHRSNYALPFSYNFTPNPAPFQQVDPAHIVKKPEVT